MSETTPESPADTGQKKRGLLWQPPMLYPTAYVWMVFFSGMDVTLTYLILRFGDAPDGGLDTAREVNPLARMVIDQWGMAGTSVYKFALIVGVIIICEVIGRRQPRTGRRLVWVCVVLAAAPVVWSLILLLGDEVGLGSAAAGASLLFW